MSCVCMITVVIYAMYIVRWHTRWKGFFQTRGIYFTYLSGREPAENRCKGEAQSKKKTPKTEPNLPN